MPKQSKRWLRNNLLRNSLCGLVGVYLLACAGLYAGQRYLIFRPTTETFAYPQDRPFNLPSSSITIPMGKTDSIHGWFIPAPMPTEKITDLPNEPSRILRSPKTLLYFTGIGGNKSYGNYLHRIKTLRRLGFAVFIVDYRGYGQSKGSFPSETQVYADAQAAWDYLTQTRRIPPSQIVLYGESFGGAIALDLATKHSDASGVIVQGTFTSMAAMADYRGWSRVFPVNLLLTERFDSIANVRSNQTVPVLFIHGTADDVVPVDMAKELYAAAPEPKALHLIANAKHFTIYQPGEQSYIKAIARFVPLLKD
jgi:uncharacterized protein